MCVQGLIQGVHDPKDTDENIVLVGRGEEYFLFYNGQYQTSDKMLRRIQIAYDKLVTVKKADGWEAIKQITSNAFGYRVTA